MSRQGCRGFLVGAWDLELIGGAGIPIGRSHAAKGVVGVGLEVAFFIEDSIVRMDEVDEADDEAVAADLDGGVLGALEGDGGLSDASDGNFFRRDGGEGEAGEFARAVWKGGGGVDHGLAEFFGDHVDDKFAAAADV